MHVLVTCLSRDGWLLIDIVYFDIYYVATFNIHTGIRCQSVRLAFSPLFPHLWTFSLSLYGPSSPLGPRDSLTLDNLFKHQASFCFVFPFLSLSKLNKHNPVPNENISDAALPLLRRKSPEKHGQSEEEQSCREACKRELCEGALGSACVACTNLLRLSYHTTSESRNHTPPSLWLHTPLSIETFPHSVRHYKSYYLTI